MKFVRNTNLVNATKLALSLLAIFSLTACPKESQSTQQLQTKVEGFTDENLKASAEKGDMKAQYWLGRSFSTDVLADTVGSKDLQQAEKWLLKSAEQNFAPAQFELSYLYDDLKQQDKYLYWVKKAAENGHAVAQHEIGYQYESEGNSKNAELWYRKAAEQGHPMDECWVGGLYQQRGNMKEAFAYYKKAVEHGALDCQDRLALLYQYGFGVEKNLIEAARLYEKAVEYGSAEAMHRLGQMHLFGVGVDENKEKAYMWITKAAAHGDPRAQKDVGTNGFFVDNDIVKMYAWIRLSYEGQNASGISPSKENETVNAAFFKQFKSKMTESQIALGDKEYEKIKIDITKNASEAREKLLKDADPLEWLKNYEKEKYFQ